jgi:5-methylcytosine-specific restriction endonuclease McrA
MSRQSRLDFENRLWKAQQGLCSICSQRLVRDERFRDDTGWNLDHVYPRSRYARLGNRGNLLLSHIACNSAKGDREPTGCERLLLEAVNARIGHRLCDMTREWRPADYQGPSPLELAFAKAGLRAQA